MDDQSLNNLIEACLAGDLTLREQWLRDFAVSLRQHICAVRAAGKLLRIDRYQLAAHDLSKYEFAEFPHYARQFHGDKSDPVGFAVAWLHHQNFNPHHWEHYISRSGRIRGALPMPEIFVREMVADWLGASRVYTGSWLIDEWCTKNVPKMQLHPHTLDRVGGILMELGYASVCDSATGEFSVRHTPAAATPVLELEMGLEIEMGLAS
jgi:hypothetical protein